MRFLFTTNRSRSNGFSINRIWYNDSFYYISRSALRDIRWESRIYGASWAQVTKVYLSIHRGHQDPKLRFITLWSKVCFLKISIYDLKERISCHLNTEWIQWASSANQTSKWKKKLISLKSRWDFKEPHRTDWERGKDQGRFSIKRQVVSTMKNHNHCWMNCRAYFRFAFLDISLLAFFSDFFFFHFYWSFMTNKFNLPLSCFAQFRVEEEICCSTEAFTTRK